MVSSSRSGQDNDPGCDQCQPKPPRASNKGKGRGKPPDLPDQEGDQDDQPRPTKSGYKSKCAQKRACEEGSDSWDSEDSIYQDMAGIARPHADAVHHAYDIPNMFGSDAEETQKTLRLGCHPPPLVRTPRAHSHMPLSHRPAPIVLLTLGDHHHHSRVMIHHPACPPVHPSDTVSRPRLSDGNAPSKTLGICE